MGNRVAPELATSENSMFVVLIVRVLTLVCATIVDNAIVDEVVIMLCLVSNMVYFHCFVY